VKNCVITDDDQDAALRFADWDRRPDRVSVRTARDRIADPAALAEGWITGAGLDVFEDAPLGADHPFRWLATVLATVLATPSIGYVSGDNDRTYSWKALEDSLARLDGSAIRTLS